MSIVHLRSLCRRLAVAGFAAMLSAPLAGLAQNRAVDLSGDWLLHFKGKEVAPGRATHTDRGGTTHLGEDISGLYKITHPAGGIVGVAQRGKVWLVGLPGGPVYDTRRTAEGFLIGPDLGNADLLQLRVRADGNLIELWKDRDGFDATLDFVFTDYTFVRAGHAETVVSAPRKPKLF